MALFVSRNKNGKRLPPIHVRRKGSTQTGAERRQERAPRTVHASELSNLKMACGNEGKYRCVIDEIVPDEDRGDQPKGTLFLKEWVGFGWIVVRPATADDVRQWPRVVRGHVK